MRIFLIAILCLAYGFIAEKIYSYTVHHNFEQPEAIGTAAIWPVFWVFMFGDEGGQDNAR